MGTAASSESGNGAAQTGGVNARSGPRYPGNRHHHHHHHHHNQHTNVIVGYGGGAPPVTVVGGTTHLGRHRGRPSMPGAVPTLGGGSTQHNTQAQWVGNSGNRGPVVARVPTPVVARPATTNALIVAPAGTSGGNSSTSASSPSSSNNSRPGAYAVSRSDGGPTQVFRVSVPLGVRPNQEFQVHAGNRVVRVRCPPDIRPGQSLQITIPPEPVVRQNWLGMAPLTSAYTNVTGGLGAYADDIDDGPELIFGNPATGNGGGAVAMTVETARRNRENAQREVDQNPTNQGEDQPESSENTSSEEQQPTSYTVTVPPGVQPGTNFAVRVNGQQLMVQCPPTARPGSLVRINPPAAPNPSPPPSQDTTSSGSSNSMSHQVFEVTVPPGVRPSSPFTIIAAGRRVLVTCPPGATPGTRIRFQLPVSRPSANKISIESVKLSYDRQDGWTRTIRVTDLKFQWIRTDEKGEMVDLSKRRFDPRYSAYVRKLIFLEGNDARMRTGILKLLPASEAAVESKVMSGDREIVSYADIATAQGKSFEKKTQWFQDACSRLTGDWNEGHIRINVRRGYLLHDSILAVMSLSCDDMRKVWRFEFVDEAGVDAGGLAREWFQLVTEQMFDPDIGLWLTSSANQMCASINSASGELNPEDHLIYFRFLGRVMGKALFDRQLVAGHMVQYLYKHILGWPITFSDLEAVDDDYYRHLSKLQTMPEIDAMSLDFTTTEEILGEIKTVNLIKNGSAVEVTSANLPEYLEANLKYKMLDRMRPQLTELLLGFYDVIPEPLLTVFDFQELELLMCGLPELDLDDWMRNTEYSGTFESAGANHQTAKWFWEVVREDFDQETRARLLQFVTGTSGVPSRGFSVLQGNDGVIRRFTIHGVEPGVTAFPRSHTCFNRIDIPSYSSKEELRQKLKVSVSTSATGFDIE